MEESGEEEESLDLILPSSLWNQQPLIACPAFLPTGELWLSFLLPISQVFLIQSSTLEEPPHPFLQNERVIWAKEKRRK